MNRTIKFRAWDSEKKVMHLVEGMRVFDPHLENEHGTLLVGKGITFVQNSIVWQQFTGLHDKNGKEIYENDLIKVNINVCVGGHAYSGDDEWIDVDYYAVVKFMPSKGFYGKVLRAINNIDETEATKHKTVTIASYRTEVIGNIYENPELAGKEE